MFFWIILLNALSSLILILSFIEIAKYIDLVDKPSERRNHTGSIPRGCGIVMLFVSLLCTILLKKFLIPKGNDLIYKISLLALILGILFFIEDVKTIRKTIRILSQTLCAILGTYFCQDKIILIKYLPYWANFTIVTIGWIWFMNLYNFMDGVDVMTSSNSIFFCLSSLLMISFIEKGALSGEELLLMSIIGVFLPFLILNWQPAKVFIGDSGTIAFGFLFAYIFLHIASRVGIIIPSIVCSYYLFDASITLIKRIVNKEKIWHPHSKHFFQIAKREGLSSLEICLRIFIANIGLISISTMLLLHNSHFTVFIGILLCFFINAILLYQFANYNKKY